jgi:hypothetical protein
MVQCQRAGTTGECDCFVIFYQDLTRVSYTAYRHAPRRVGSIDRKFDQVLRYRTGGPGGQIKETVLTRTELKAVIIIYSACALGSSLRPTSQGGRSDVSSFSAVERLQEGEEVTHVFDDSGTTGHRRRTGGRREYLCRCAV